MKCPINSRFSSIARARMCAAVVALLMFAGGCTDTQAPVVSVQVLEDVVMASPERLGVNLGPEAYYGDQQYVENPLLHGGFSMGRQTLLVQIGSGTANEFSDADFIAGDPDRSLARTLAGGTYYVATGARHGERGRILEHDLATATFTTEKSGPVFSEGDFVWLSGPDVSRGEPEPSDPGIEQGLGIGDFRVFGDAGTSVLLAPADAHGRDQMAQIILPPEGSELGGGLKHYIRATPATTYRLHIRARSALPGARIVATLVNLAIATGEQRTQGFDLIDGGPLASDWHDLILETRTPDNPAITGSFSAIEITGVGNNKGTQPASIDLDSVRLEDYRLQSDTVFSKQIVNTLKEARVGTLRFYSVFDIGVTVADATARDTTSAGWSYLSLASGYRLNQVTATIDGCLGLAKEVGARPWLTIGNANTPDDWYALISYLAAPAGFDGDSARRAENGHAAPWLDDFDRIYLEIGNEWWNPIFYPFHTALPATYGDICRFIIQAARSNPHFDADRIKIVAGGWAINAHNWNGIVDKKSEGHDYVSIAPYLLNELDRAVTAQDKYGALFASVDGFAMEGGASTRAALAENGRGTGLAVYELNTHLTGGSASTDTASEICTSAAAGVAVLDQAMSLMTNFGASPINYFVLLQRDFNGRLGLWGNLIREPDGALRPRPVWHGLRLANRYFLDGDLVRTVSEGGGTWQQPQNGSVPAISSVPNVHSYACIAQDIGSGKRRANVLIINRSVSSPVRASVALPFGASPSVKSIGLVGNRASQNNEASEVVALRESTIQWPGADGSVLLPPSSATVFQFSEI